VTGLRVSPSGRAATALGAARRRRVLPGKRPRRLLGIAVAAVSVAIATVAVYLLKQVAPVVSLSVVYLPAVLLVSTYWGAGLGLATALASAASFNFFHLRPIGRFTIADGRNWVALAAFVVVALATSAVAELARARALEAERGRAEADLAAALARELLLGDDTERALASAARRLSEALGLRSAAIVTTGHGTAGGTADAPPLRTDDRREALPLHTADGTRIGTLLVPGDLDADVAANLRERVVPTLEALVAIAQRRDALQLQRVETEALRRSDEIKTALLRAVSHDLRTPLTSVVAAGHALGAGTLSESERSELSDAVVSQATRLAGLVDNLLDLSRLQAGAAQPRADWVSVEDLLSEALAGRDGEPIEIRMNVDPGVPEIRADAAQLERAFANLLENASRYGAGEPVLVRVRHSAGRVLVSVTDRGPGIDPGEQERIFEPFYQAPPRRDGGSSPRVGSGLGLAIVKGFVEANGGAIEVESLPGQGTSFIVSLPVPAPDSPAPTSEGDR
jgi:two-component system, OmpR family, sensor histidine kinase KdpD